MYTASIYFMGQYRPAYFQAKTAADAVSYAVLAVNMCPDRRWFIERLDDAVSKLTGNCTSYSADHGCRGVALRTGPHDPFLDSVTRSMPAYPGLDYSDAANA